MTQVVAITSHNFELWLGSLISLLVLVALAMFLRLRGKTLVSFIATMLDRRADQIEAQLKMAEQNRQAAQKAHDEAEAEIAEARREAADIVSRAESIKGALRTELATAADQDRDRIVGQAREAIENERNRAILELRTRAADVAVDAAREVLRRTVDAGVDQQIISRALTETESNGHGAKA
jgi:F-type H+-transporting ATPase subunit b